MRTLLALAFAALLGAQSQSRPPVHTLGSATVAEQHPGGAVAVRELAGGRVLVQDRVRHQFYILNATLTRVEVLFDSTEGLSNSYPEGARIVPYLHDSTMVFDAATQSFLVLDPDGKQVRVAAAPLGRESYRIANPGTVATDSRGRVVYQIPAPSRPFPPCEVGAAAPTKPTFGGDSTIIARGDFDLRKADTVGRVTAAAVALPVVTSSSDCRAIAARFTVMPIAKPIDDWTVTSSGAIAIVRGGTYSIDWIEGDSMRYSTPRMPFDWRRITDEEKQAKIDSARAITDSVARVGGYQVRACRVNGISSLTFASDAPLKGPSSGRSSGAGVAGGSAGVSGGAEAASGAGGCVTLPVARDFPALSEMPDYLPPIRRGSVLADRDDNVWILPTTSLEAKNGLLYDVVDRKGELFERVQLPLDRTIAGFGKDGVVYLAWRDAGGAWTLERRRIQR